METPKVLTGIHALSDLLNISEELLLLARDKVRKLHATGTSGLPIGLEGFHESGRIYVTELLTKWLQDNATQLEQDFDGSREYWLTMRDRYKALTEQLNYEREKNRLCNKADVVQLLQRIFAAQNSLLNDRFLQDLPARAMLTPEQITHVETIVHQVLQVMQKEGLDQWKKR